MKQLLVLIAFSVALGSTVGVPAPEISGVNVMDSDSVAEIAEVSNEYLQLEKRAVSRCKL